MLEHLAGLWPAAARAEDPRSFRIEGEALALLRHAFREHIAHREATLGVRDRRGKVAVEPEATMLVCEIDQRGDRTGNCREGAALRWEAHPEQLAIDRARGGTGTVVGADLPGPCVIHERKDVPAERGAVRHHHSADRSRRHCRIDRVAPLAQCGETR